MPAPLNIIGREYSQQTRAPSAHLMRAFSNMYDVLAEMEQPELSAPLTLTAASSKVGAAIQDMKVLSDVKDNWDIKFPVQFELLMSKFHSLTDQTPVGDKSMIEVIVRELHDFDDTLKRQDDVPKDNDVEQFHFAHRVISQSIRLQEILLLSTQISLVTKQVDD